MATAEQMMSVAFGNRPMATNTGATTTFTANASGLKVKEASKIAHFYDDKGVAVITHWEDVDLDAEQDIWFGKNVKSIAVTTGGKGEYYLAETDF